MATYGDPSMDIPDASAAVADSPNYEAGWQTATAAPTTAPVGATADDPLYAYAAGLDSMFTAGTSTVGASAASDKWDWAKPLDSVFKALGFSGDSKSDGMARAATIAAAGGLLAGAGQGYFAGKKREQEMEIAKQQIDVNKLTANSQAALNAQRMSNQAGVYKFNPVGLINQPAKTTPV